MFCENCACRRVLRVSYCVAQSCRVFVACSCCTVIFFVFFLRIMIREHLACFSTLCLKMGAYFQNVFELNTAEHKLLGFTIPHLESDSGDRNRANEISCKANWHSFTYFWIMIMIREYRACFILHSA